MGIEATYISRCVQKAASLRKHDATWRRRLTLMRHVVEHVLLTRIKLRKVWSSFVFLGFEGTEIWEPIKVGHFLPLKFGN